MIPTAALKLMRLMAVESDTLPTLSMMGQKTGQRSLEQEKDACCSFRSVLIREFFF